MSKPKQWEWAFRSKKRADALGDIKSRLEAEVGRCLRVLMKARTGHWAMVRMLMPIIEATSVGKQWDLLRTLGVPYPSVAWLLYRNTLLHKDEMRIVLYRAWRVGWELDYTGGHSFRRASSRGGALLRLDLRQLYEDLVSYLDKEIAKAKVDRSRMQVPHRLRILSGHHPSLKGEIEQLCRKPKKRK
jgi:hypothetical protein